MGKKGDGQRKSLNKFKWKTLAQLHKGSLVCIIYKLQLGILIAEVMTGTFWKKISFQDKLCIELHFYSIASLFNVKHAT